MRRNTADDSRWETLNCPVQCRCDEVVELSQTVPCYTCRTEPLCDNCLAEHMKDFHSARPA